MLHWLAGAKAPEPSDPYATGYVEPPETPAPVFAVRAFKHAIFGTPQTVQPKPRRNSNTQNTRPGHASSRPERPIVTRPKSAGDARALGLLEGQRSGPEPMASPTKGILMTPGTAAAKRKTVTFGEQVTRDESKRPTRRDLPEDCPGKFPSPWTKPNTDDIEDEDFTETGRIRSRSKLTDALEQVRDESTKRNRSEIRDEAEQMKGIGASCPRRECCEQWKAQFDAYREKSQRDVRKLIQKQKMAKDFARDKDLQCTDLADQLRQERKLVDRLEKRAADLEAQIQAMQQVLARVNSGTVEAEPADVAAKLAAVAVQQRQRRYAVKAEQNEAAIAVDPSRIAATTAAQKEDKAPERDLQSQCAPEKSANVEIHAIRVRERFRLQAGRMGASDDIWNQALRSSSPARSSDKSHSNTQSSRTVTSGTGLTPLKSLNINTLPTAKLNRRDSAQPSLQVDRLAKEPLVRQEVVHQRSISGDMRAESPLLPTTSGSRPADTREVSSQPPGSPKSHQTAAGPDDLTMPVPPSSPFMITPEMSPVAGSPKCSYFDRREHSPSKAAPARAVKENAPPPVKPLAAAAGNVKPTAAWNAINAPASVAVRRTTTSMTTRDGRQVSADRLEAAKARMAARGRVVS